VTIPTNVINIGDDLFGECGLTSVTIAEGVTNLGIGEFADCTNLTSVTIPGSVTSIGYSAFGDCTSLSSINFQGNAPSDGGDMFYGDTKATAYYLPGTSGWSSPFAGLPALMLNPPVPAGSLEVTISPASATNSGAQWQVDDGTPQPSGATVLGLSVGNHTVSFSTITGWTTPTNQIVSVSANSTATATGMYTEDAEFGLSYATNGGGTLTIIGYIGPGGTLTVPTYINGLSVTIIGESAFVQANLTSVTIPGSVTSIGVGAFELCYRLGSVTISNGVTSIGAYAFGQTSLTNVTIPSSVTNIGDSVFVGCTNLTGITVNASNSFYSSRNGVLFDIDQSTLIEYPNGVSGNYTIPEGVTNIGPYAFNDCTSVTGVTIPSSVNSIGADAFVSCSSLANVTLTNGLANIGSSRWFRCVHL
jgi:hypothetical protein